MSKNQHTPRGELICGKLDLVFSIAQAQEDVGLAELTEHIRHDAERMEQKLISRKGEVEELEKERDDLKDKIIEAVGWAYADCCTDLDKGIDPRKTDMNDVLKRVEIDLGIKKEQGE